jgi:Flp pilus assembly protein TadG
MSRFAVERFVAGAVRSIHSFWNDTSGLMLPYMTLMLTVLVGLGLLALDAARFMSLQTQMQAAADALALAGARELDKQSGAQTRAISAMANAYGSETGPNTLSGMGITPTLTYTYTFYERLPAATAGLTGTPAEGDTDSKYVQVTVAPQQIPTIFPVPVGANSFSTGASAIAGFTGILPCVRTPFRCDPTIPLATADMIYHQVELYR